MRDYHTKNASSKDTADQHIAKAAPTSQEKVLAEMVRELRKAVRLTVKNLDSGSANVVLFLGLPNLGMRQYLERGLKDTDLTGADDDDL